MGCDGVSGEVNNQCFGEKKNCGDYKFEIKVSAGLVLCKGHESILCLSPSLWQFSANTWGPELVKI